MEVDMPRNGDADLFAELRKIDTPSITNVVATYPTNPVCLGLYNPWSENWYTDTSIRCMYPELGAVAGYAVTCVYSVPDPNYNRLTFMDVIDALDASPKPTILVLQQKFPPELAAKAGLAGEIMVTSMQAVGCVGLVSNGPSRDIDAIRALRFQYLLSGASAGHGGMAVQAVNVPVTVGGMDVQPGEIVHMDENGACKFPADKIEAVLANVNVLLKDEATRLTALRQAKTAAEVRAAFSGGAYSDPKSSAPKR
jgi:4-hydroxy-4-methyl-2-oxoglutarate aldolase